ncbi:SAM-dependent methyltransferase, partial [Planobispora rosea]
TSSIHDCLLGGKTHFPLDRTAAQRLGGAIPTVAAQLREHDAFVERAVRHLAQEGIIQFLDLGCGLPRLRNVHEIAGAVTPNARTVYVDRDELVVTHGRALLTADGVAAVVPGDLRDPRAITGDLGVRALLDFNRPAAVLLTAVLHFADAPAGIIAELCRLLAPGSAVVISHACRNALPDEVEQEVVEVFADTDTPIALRTAEEIRTLFDGLDVAAPGVVPVAQWRPDHDLHYESPQIIGGVGTWRGRL